MTRTWALFDRLADTYDEVIPFFATFGAALVDMLDPPAGTRVLDVGAGVGAISIPAAARGCQVTAVDASPRMIARLSAARTDLTTHVMDAEHLDFPAGAFDLATAGFVIHVVADPAAVVAGLRRIVRSGGTVAFTVPGRFDDGGRWDRHQAIVREFEPRATGPGRPGRYVEVDELLAAAGFVGIREENLQVHLPVPDPDTFWRFQLSHGFAGFVESLSPADAAEFHGRVTDELTRMQEDGGIVVDRGATVVMGTVA